MDSPCSKAHLSCGALSHACAGRRRAGHGWDSFGGGRGERARSTRETSGGERGDGEGESESVPQDEEFQEAMREAKRLETLFDLMGR